MNRDIQPSSTQERLAAKLAWLTRAECYPEGTRTVEARETHFAWVFFTDRHAYKLKKPVQFEGADFRTLAVRGFSCREEIRLNRRLAPGVYLGVLPLVQGQGGSMRISGPGRVVEWLVWMRRLAAERMLDARLATGKLHARELVPVLGLLAEFHAALPRVAMTASGYRRRLEAQVERNRDALLQPELGLDRRFVRALTGRQLEFLATRHALVGLRADRIVDAHGDLRPEHVFLGEPPAVIDCLEFDRDLRILDPAEELAYLGLECALGGADWILALALQRYTACSGDKPAAEIVDFYTSHRATTRAKIVAWHLRDPQYRDREDWSASATGYLRAAEAALDCARAAPFADQCSGAC